MISQPPTRWFPLTDTLEVRLAAIAIKSIGTTRSNKDIAHMHIWRFDQPLVNIPMLGRQTLHQQIHQKIEMTGSLSAFDGQPYR
jgi:hypothetical protein